MITSTTTEFGTLQLDMDDVPKGTRLFMGLSGGLDSSYMAWRLLKMGYPLVLHCCEFHTPNGRHLAERNAQDAVLDWLIAEGLTEFRTYRTSVDLGLFSVDWDLHYLFWAMTLILRNYNDINYFVSPAGTHDEDLEPEMHETLNTILTASVPRNVAGLVPKGSYSKAEFLADMPPELIGLCSWCRKPDDGNSCHQCASCVIVDKALGELGIEFEYN